MPLMYAMLTETDTSPAASYAPATVLLLVHDLQELLEKWPSLKPEQLLQTVRATYRKHLAPSALAPARCLSVLDPCPLTVAL